MFKRNINSQVLDFPESWYCKDQGFDDNLTELQHICPKICGESDKEEIISHEKKVEYKQQIEELMQRGSDLTLMHHSFYGRFLNTVLLEALSCEGGKDEFLADTLIEMAVEYQQP